MERMSRTATVKLRSLGVVLLALGVGVWIWSALPQAESAEEQTPPTATGRTDLLIQPGAVPVTTVIDSGAAGFSVWFDTVGLGITSQQVSAGEFVELGWPDASIAGAIGEPALPVVRRLFVAPPEAKVTVSVIEGEKEVINLETAGLPWRVMPVQPPIEKIPGALEQAVFQFNEAAYAGRVHLSDARATVEEVGIARGQRLMLLEVRPIAYAPDARSLTRWGHLDIQVEFKGGQGFPTDLSPLPGLAGVVLNPDQLPAGSTRGSGNYLIIVDTAYEAAIASFASAKAGQGFAVTTHTVDGDTNSAIKSYIESLWGGANSPDYVLLVGDTDTIPHWTGGGEGSPSTDLPYSCMDGGDDWYPDIALGRFPVRTTGHVSAIVDKTLYYEAGVYDDPDYKMRAVFMASTDNYSVTEGTHNWVINNYMDPNGYTSDKLYTYTYGATTQDTRDAFNDGRFFGIYSGHGATTYWADGPVFYQSDVNALTNSNMYPFVCSFACVTGTYTLDECFTETWIRAADKGAVTIYGSSVNSYWTEDDVLEKRLFDSIFDEGDAVPPRVGSVWNDTRTRYLAQMGSGSTTRRYFEMYNLMGDPSMLFFGTETPPTGLQVSPFGDLDAEGQAGGPFTPDSIVYTLENLNDTGIDYSVTKSASWVSLSDTGGYLAGHATTDVTVSINSNANSLSNGTYTDTVNFINTTDHDGDTTRDVTLVVGVPTLQYSWDMNTNPGWSTQGLWAWGQPTGGGGQYGGPDPTSGYTGSNVYGYNLSGDYENLLSETHLTTTAIDCSQLSQVSVKFWRWLGVEQPTYDHAYVRVSHNGSTWTQVWTNNAEVTDSAWTQVEYDLSSVADGESTVYLRWTMGPTDSSWQYCGWNIDDVEIWGLGGGPECEIDDDCDDGLFCNGAETCVDQICQPGTNPCDDGVDCTDDVCDEVEDACTTVANDAYCDNGLYCDGAEICDPYLDCQPGTPVTCDDSVGCTDDSCNETTDSCDYIPNDSHCDNGLYCDGAETCHATLGCQVGTAVDCNDGVGCTDDSCNEGTDSCDNIANDANCPDDGSFCNGTEYCDAVNDCSSTGDPCLPNEVCNEVTDECDPSICDNDGICEPGEDCNTCPGDCFAGSGAVCGNNICETADGEDCESCPDDCNSYLIGGPAGRYCCGDGTAKYGVTCADGRCTGDGNTCTTDPAESSCCGDGVCEGAEDVSNCAVDCGCTGPADCDDANECTVDDCVGGACQNSPVADGTPCGGGICCGGACAAPVCSGDADCDDGEACTADTCVSPGTCSATCDSVWASCGPADGCCGPACTPADDPDCDCLPRGAPCTEDAECCSNRCFKGFCK